MSAVRAIRPAPTPPFLVDELPPAKAPGYAKSAWRLMAEANPGRWVCVKVAPGTCADRATRSMTAKGFRSCYRKLDDASEFGVNGPAVVTFAMFGGAA